MSVGKKLELTWVGKGKEYNLEPRILLYDADKSYGDENTENMLIHGDNLLALKALEQEYSGKVKCIYIDPPYNTGNAFEHYDDGLEHSIWLELMYERLILLYKLLSENGIIFINLDENEHAYCKVLCDEIFGRKNFIGDLIWQKRKGGGNDSHFFAIDHDYIIVYAKNADKKIHNKKWKVAQSEKYLKRYKEIDEKGYMYYWDTLARDGLQNPIPVSVNCPDGFILKINSQKSQNTIENELRTGSIRLIKSKNGWTLHHRVYMPNGQVLRSILSDIGTNKTAGDEIKTVFGNIAGFDYPKPETLLKKVLDLVTNKGDLVLDSFLGSGTTAAVAHKMNRKYIGIELGNHCYTHAKVRLDKVIDGEQGGISKSVGWSGGGGYKFYELAPSLLKKDNNNQWVIDTEKYNANMLAAAMAKLHGYKYNPDSVKFFKQGLLGNSQYIFTTTNHLNFDMLDEIAKDIKDDESLLICAASFDNNILKRYENISIKKIPQSVLNKCEFARENYNLNIIDLSEITEEDFED